VIALLLTAWVRTTVGSSCPAPNVPVYWAGHTLPFVIDAAGTPDTAGAFDAVRASFHAWEQSCSSLRFRDDGTRAGLTFGNDGVNAVKWVETGWMGAVGALAITTLTYHCSDGSIIDADIALNGENFTFDTAGSATRADVQNTVTHEAGHFVGFAHSADTESTMYASAQPGETKKRDLTADDIDGLCTVYPDGGVTPQPDAGTSDAGLTGSDAGIPSGTVESGGCATAAGAPWLLLLLFWKRRR
jgi:hypothetical protein